MITESYVTLTCRACGHEEDFMAFCQAPVGGELPRGEHQCPKCRHAWRMMKVEPDRIYESGLFVPGRRKAVEMGGGGDLNAEVSHRDRERQPDTHQTSNKP